MSIVYHVILVRLRAQLIAGAVRGGTLRAINLVGEGLNDAMNPRLRERQ